MNYLRVLIVMCQRFVNIAVQQEKKQPDTEPSLWRILFIYAVQIWEKEMGKEPRIAEIVVDYF